MFYRPEDGHGLPHNPLTAIVTPRPIAWVGTRGPTGDNLAPYSFFNAIAYEPPQVMFASTGRKDSVTNIEGSGVFSISIVEYAAREAMNQTSGAWPSETDEFAFAGVPKAECITIPCPYVATAPATFECKLTEIINLRGQNNFLILGMVTGVHLRDDCVVGGRFDVTRFHPLARSGYKDYAVVTEVFEMTRPGQD
ncbi:flavin reductase family protein [Defluviimonas aestuarii]|uniref:flavin reductase family protein n=1 Tax=Albidovulum aestuarii TaxID=1130726 RepID=UPI00249BD823|nr:flavin reductase family protein [Defluviimonas aestuarii]MDI3336462.1 flavin reductase family protein [Defluviimonas aestuarii]